MGIGERQIKNKSGKVTKSRTITICVDTGERYPNGKKKYKQIVRSLGRTQDVPKAEARAIFDREESKYKKNKSYAFSPTLADFAPRYIAHKRDAEGKRSWERDQYSLRALISYFGRNTQLSQIDSKDIDEYKVERQKTVSPKTVNNELECLRNLYNQAAKWEEFAGHNPVSKAGLIRKIVRDKKQPPTPQEEALLFKQLNPNIARIFTFAANTGMRITEVIELEIDQIHETQSFEDGETETIELAVLNPSDTKTGEGRAIPLNYDAKLAKDESLEFNNGRDKRIFLNTRGKPYTSHNAVYLAMKRACRAAGIRRITPHDLRRRFASRVIDKGGNILDTRTMMGHASFKMLESYVTTSTSMLRAVQAIEEKRPVKLVKKLS